MKRTLCIFAVAAAQFTRGAFALTDSDAAALKRLTEEYVLWDYSGRPVEFRERLDYESFEEQRGILLKLAEIQWDGVWGDYWRKLGVKDLATLRALSPKDFWVRFHSVVKPGRGSEGKPRAKHITVDIHAMTEARGVSYVIYQAGYPSRAPAAKGNIEVLRARWSEGEWRVLAIPRVTAALRKQLDEAEKKK
jgi:hypothetical protein